MLLHATRLFALLSGNMENENEMDNPPPRPADVSGFDTVEKIWSRYHQQIKQSERVHNLN